MAGTTAAFYTYFVTIWAHFSLHFNQVARASIDLASVLSALGKYEEAEQMYKSALHIREAHFGRDSLESLSALSDMATMYQNMGQLSEAESVLNDILHINERVHGADSPAVAQVLDLVETIYYYKKSVYYLLIRLPSRRY
jgi:tetratricopeptide (TPR) repeat protein